LRIRHRRKEERGKESLAQDASADRGIKGERGIANGVSNSTRRQSYEELRGGEGKGEEMRKLLSMGARGGRGGRRVGY